MNISFATTQSPDQASKMNVSLVTSQELELFKEEIFKRLEEITSGGKIERKSEMMRTAEVKKFLRVSEKKVAQLRSSGDLPFTKVHGMLYYKTSDVEALFNPINN